MLKKIKNKVESIHSQDDKTFAENEANALEKKKNANLQEYLYSVKGMHCASCEVLIEKKLLEIKEIKSVEAKSDKGEVLIEYVGKKPETALLNSIFKEEGYVFFDEPFEKEDNSGKSFLKTATIALSIIVVFLFLNKSGFSSLVNVNSKSSLPVFFALGLVAGFSSCAALVGGLVLSMSKQWRDMHSSEGSISEKLQPHLMFNIGRIISYAFFGAILGFLGSKLQISFQFTSFLVIAVSIVMFFLAMQMLGFKSFRKFQFTLPKFATRYIANEANFKGRYLPFSMGSLTFFLPCGFTITAQGLALLSGNPLQGGLIMTFFALGTAPALLLIGFSAIKFSSRPSLALQFSKVAGILILFFALFNINSQLNVLGLPSLANVNSNPAQSNNGGNGNALNEKDLPSIVDGKQLIKMKASSSGYAPNYFKVRAGIPVRWEIEDVGTSGCTNAIISRSLFSGQIDLTPGKTSIKEFTPAKPGKYKFSCWMGMISGTIEAVDANAASQNSTISSVDASESVIPSGVNGCGCGGGGNGSCGVK